jgi:hypothetical protein
MSENPQAAQPGQPQFPAPGQQYPAPGQQYPAPGQAYPQQYPGQPAPLQYAAGAPPTKTNGLAIGALVAGVLALFVCAVPFVNIFSILAGAAAVVMGLIGARKASALGGKGLAIAGIITGALAVVVSIIVLVAVLFFIQETSDDVDEWNTDVQDLNEQIQDELEDMDSELDNG